MGTLLVLAVAAGFAVADVDAGMREARLDAYAEDAATVLRTDPPTHNGTTRISAVSRSDDGFRRERGGLARRMRELLPESVLFRVRTPQGVVGPPRPAGVPTGRAVVPTGGGEVVIRVWYA